MYLCTRRHFNIKKDENSYFYIKLGKFSMHNKFVSINFVDFPVDIFHPEGALQEL